jgi:hypothetical protein
MSSGILTASEKKKPILETTTKMIFSAIRMIYRMPGQMSTGRLKKRTSCLLARMPWKKLYTLEKIAR